MRKLTLFTILVFVFLVTSQEIAFAEGAIAWDPRGMPVCTELNTQQNMRMVSDGCGGAIIVWEDYRSGNADIYAQRIDENGKPKWSLASGVVVCTDTARQEHPVIVGDGYGGAIIAWEDSRSGPPNIYALRISSDTGWPYASWDPNGKALSSTTYSQMSPDIASVGYDGAVITWQETDGSGNWGISAQRIKYDGVLGWPTSNTKVKVTATDPAQFPRIINDGQSYVIITWEDWMGGDWNIYAQRMSIIDGMKAGGWDPSNGQVVSNTGEWEIKPELVPDGSGGAIIAWEDSRSIGTTAPDIYAQRILSNGTTYWGGGIPICKADGEQNNPVIINSLIGGITDGAIIAWEDRRDDLNGDIYAVKVGLYESDSDLTLGAKAIATGSQCQRCPRLVSDNQGGGIGAWIEKDPTISQCQIFATKRDQYGNPVWSSYPGVLVCQGSGIKCHQIVTDDAGGIIVAWEGIGADGSYDIFAQRVIEGAPIPTASISGRVTLSDKETGITGVDVWALRDERLVSSVITGTNGDYGLTGLTPNTIYVVRANWMVNDIEFSVSKEAFAPSYDIDFTLEKDYLLGTIAGNVIGVEREARRVSASGFKNSLSPGNGTAFVELEQRGKVIVKVPLEIDGSYIIPNLLPGRFIARAYNGTIYSDSKMVNLKEGETLRVDFAFGIMPEETVFNYPNPAKNGSTTIRYYCGYTDPEAEIKIYNINGELVRGVGDSEVDETDAPIYKFLWDCKNSSGKEVASGIYIYIVEVKEKSTGEAKKVVRKMALVR